MKNLLFTYTILLLSFKICFSQNANLKLWYKNPADATVSDAANVWKDNLEWLKALPLGNGNIGAMVFGDVNRERIQLNEKTLWSGSNQDSDNPESSKHIPEIRKLLFEGKFKEATDLTNKTQVCKGKGSNEGLGANAPFGCFQTLGDLWLDFGKKTNYQKYYRDLNLNEAVANVTYEQDAVVYKREYFVNAPTNVLVIRLTANKKAAISFSAELNRPERFITAVEKDQLLMSGTLNDGLGGKGMEYITRVKAVQKGGSQVVSNNKIAISEADEVVLYLTASTNYLDVYPVYSGNKYREISQKNLKVSVKKGFDALKKEHISDYQQYFNRVSLQIAADDNIADISTDERLRTIKDTKNDNYLTQLYFQYGRYLLISSTRENTLPANLQGIWANKIQTAWNGDYHTNINVQMNYWLAENTNLNELHLSLTKFIQKIEKPATKSARVQFAMNGWCVNPIVNVWGFTSPGEHPSWGLTASAGGWLCQHLWEHYLFTLDKKYLESVYPTLKNAAKFYANWITLDNQTNKLVSGPSSSPENSFKAPDNSNGSISMAPSHDQEIIDELFTNVIQASQIVKDKDHFVQDLEVLKGNLFKVQIAHDGRIMEWAMPYQEKDQGHRHLSHLYALYPGYAFNSRDTPQYLAAAQKSLEYRLKYGGGKTGWSTAWVANLWARLGNGDDALVAFNKILINNSADNLFDLHPPFQIDGNFGAAASVAEMLVQSHIEKIQLLPALPKLWMNGHVKGLSARGGFTVDIKWENGKLVSAKLFSKVGGACKLQYNDKVREIQTKLGGSYVLNDNLIEIF